MIIFVGSTNPVKINAVTQAASERWPEVKVLGIDVPSGVSNQPRTDAETREGAEHRAESAFQEGLNLLSEHEAVSYNDGELDVLGLGLEGGVERKADELWSTVWACVFHPEHGMYEVNGARFKLPDEISKPIMAGDEMGDVAQKLMHGIDVKRKNGMIGLVTNNFIDRTEEYSSLAKLAIGLWYGRNWYEQRSIT